MGTMDFVLIGGIVLFGIIGLWKGGAKIFFGLFMLLIIMVGAAFISASVTPLFLSKTNADGSIEYTSAAQAIMTPVGEALPSNEMFSAVLDTDIVLGEDGVLYVGEDSDIPLNGAVSENIPVVGPYLASFLEATAVPGTTLRNSISYTVARFAFEIVIWVILVIILAIIRNIIRKKIFRWLDDKSHSAMSKIDRVIGLAVSIAIFVAILWGFGGIVARFDNGSNWANTIDNMFLEGKLAKPFMCANPLLKLLGLTLPVSGNV
ncbi:MAG: hypothetical protein IJU10_03655 [Clostridia bacterium]|nr:hypothetical protein [Clostridia bacterium]